MITDPSVRAPGSPGRVLKLARARLYARNGHGADVRRAHDMALQDIADAVGVSASTIWRWERGTCSPLGEAAVRWCELLDALEASLDASA